MRKNFLKKETSLFKTALLSLLLLLLSFEGMSQTPDFNPNVDGFVNSIVLQNDGKILIGGRFIQVGSVSRPFMARINSNGKIDLDFEVNLDNEVTALAIQDDGKILVAGRFTAIGGNNGFVRNGLARLNSDGSIDPNFAPDFNDFADRILVQPDGKILVGGVFSSTGGVEVSELVRLNNDGSVDSTFNVGNLSVRASALLLQPDGKILIGGAFTSVDGIERERVARLNSDGSVDMSFRNPEIAPRVAEGSIVRALALQEDGKIIVGGSFGSAGSRIRSNIARLNSDGSLDLNFNPIANRGGEVTALKLQDNGEIIVGGNFIEIGGVRRLGMAKLNQSGSVIEGFDPNIVAPGLVGPVTSSNPISITSLVIQDDEKILVGGLFARVSSVTRTNLARLNADGSLEAIILNLCVPIKAPNGTFSVTCL